MSSYPYKEKGKMKIVAENTVPYLKGIAESIAEVKYLNSNEFTSENIHDADALIVRSINKCTRELLENSQVRLITTATIGFDHIDIEYCDKAGITWQNAPGCNAVSVAQYVLASLITVALRKKEPLQGKTIGIVGVGHVGKELATLCTAYGLHVLRNDPPRAEAEGNEGFVSLDTLAEESDIITFHTPLTKEGRFRTRHLANEDFFNKTRKRPWFINASRGAVHDTQALLNALKSGKIGEAIIDCWENEPAIDRELLDKVAIATPHIAGFSADGKANGTHICLENIERFFNVKIEKLDRVLPPAPVDPVIDLAEITADRIEQAVFRSFNPLTADKLLRESLERFEWFRANYHHPREFAAYTVRNATAEERVVFDKLGFR